MSISSPAIPLPVAPPPVAPPPVVRLLGPADVRTYRALRLEALRLEPLAFASSLAEEEQVPLAVFTRHLAKRGSFGGFIGTALAGSVVFTPQGLARMRHKASLTLMYVRPAARGTGLADALVERLLSHARGRVEQVQLAVAASNLRAIRFYERHGFRIFATEPRALRLGSGYADDHWMMRRIDG